MRMACLHVAISPATDCDRLLPTQIVTTFLSTPARSPVQLARCLAEVVLHTDGGRSTPFHVDAQLFAPNGRIDVVHGIGVHTPDYDTLVHHPFLVYSDMLCADRHANDPATVPWDWRRVQ